MVDRIFIEGDESVKILYKDNGDGSYTPYAALKSADAGGGLTDTELRATPLSVVGLTKNITVTPTLSVGATYVTGDFVGTSGSAMEFALAARANGGTGWILGALIENTVAESIPLELWLFDSAVTPPNDSAAWTLSDGDAAKCIGVLTFGVETSWFLSAANAVCRSASVAIPFTCGVASRSIYGCLVTRGVLTGAPTVRLNIAQD